MLAFSENGNIFRNAAEYVGDWSSNGLPDGCPGDCGVDDDDDGQVDEDIFGIGVGNAAEGDVRIGTVVASDTLTVTVDPADVTWSDGELVGLYLTGNFKATLEQMGPELQARTNHINATIVANVGNTITTLGVYDGEDLRATWRFATDIEKLPDEYGVLALSLLQHESLNPEDVHKAIMACVVPDLEPVFDEVCRRYFGIAPLHVTAGVRTGLRILYDTPREVGADRVADAVAAIKLYGPPLIIVDLSMTATVFDAISKEGDYLGGAISPGLGIASEALFRRAAKLYRVELDRPKAAIGRNTISAIQSGIVFGYVGLIEGIVNRMKEELGQDAKVIATGGYAPLIAGETDVIHEKRPAYAGRPAPDPRAQPVLICTT